MTMVSRMSASRAPPAAARRKKDATDLNAVAGSLLPSSASPSRTSSGSASRLESFTGMTAASTATTSCGPRAGGATRASSASTPAGVKPARSAMLTAFSVSSRATPSGKGTAARERRSAARESRSASARRPAASRAGATPFAAPSRSFSSRTLVGRSAAAAASKVEAISACTAA